MVNILIKVVGNTIKVVGIIIVVVGKQAKAVGMLHMVLNMVAYNKQVVLVVR